MSLVEYMSVLILSEFYDDFRIFTFQGPDLLWEQKFIKLAVELDENNTGPIESVDVSAVRRLV